MTSCNFFVFLTSREKNIMFNSNHKWIDSPTCHSVINIKLQLFWYTRNKTLQNVLLSENSTLQAGITPTHCLSFSYNSIPRSALLLTYTTCKNVCLCVGLRPLFTTICEHALWPCYSRCKRLFVPALTDGSLPTLCIYMRRKSERKKREKKRLKTNADMNNISVFLPFTPCCRL